MGNFKFKVAYTTDKSKIEPAIEAGTIDQGDLIIINEDGAGSMKFITDEGDLIGMDATLTDEQEQNIINKTLTEADERYVAITEGTIIVNGNTSLIEENAATASSSADFASAIADETVTSITLAADVVTDDIVLVTERDLAIDLAGCKLGNEEAMWDSDTWSVIRVANATLTLDDSSNTGIVESPEGDCYAIDIQENGTVYINGGTYNGNISAIYLKGANASCYITGGYFKIQQLNENGVESPYGLLINVYNEFRNSAKVVITGGTFEGFNPAEPEEGDMVFVPSGYTVEYDETNNTYTVIEEE